MPRIAVVNDIAGVARAEVQWLRDAGWDVDFYELPKPGALWPRWAKVLLGPVRVAVTTPIVVNLRRGRYDLVHVHYVSQGFLGALSGRPFVLHAHGSDLHQNLKNPLYRAWTRMWMQRARAIFYVTPNLADFLADFKSKARYLPNPIDTDAFARVPPAEALRRGLIFMRLQAIKGTDIIFAAVDRLRRLIELTAFDWGPQAAQLRRTFGDRVTFVPPVAHDRVPELVASFDLVIGQMEQGIAGLSELEGMAAARAVLMRLDTALYAGDPPPVVNVATADDMVAAIDRLKDDREELARLGAAGREWVRLHHSPQAHIKALVDAYREVLGASR